ncbi:extensin family protein [Camelimonas abortus]|uniref:Extensin family protein n=1 Tax=Camelimonas abortus TaxID=1017184 RepID=A0ABV7LBK2_9HYPH
MARMNRHRSHAGGPRRGPRALARLQAILAAVFVLALAGCGMFETEKREPWRSQAEAQCLARKQVRPSAFMQRMRAINGPGACGMDAPFRVTAILNGAVRLRTPGVLACPMIAALEEWTANVVIPAALKYYGSPVAAIDFGSYSCRRINNGRRGRRSEHAFGNAADFMGLTLADGRRVSVKRGWRGTPADQEFLRTVFTGACARFSTVLGPGSDAYHHDHLHLDLARHGRGRMICRPVLKWSPMVPAPFEPGPDQPQQSYGAYAAAPAAGGRSIPGQSFPVEETAAAEPAGAAGAEPQDDAGLPADQGQPHDGGDPDGAGAGAWAAAGAGGHAGGPRSIDDLLR